MQRDTDKDVLKSIEENNLIFISAQPDSVYFHWQVSLYLYQFAKHNIISRCYVLFGYSENSPSDYVLKLASKYPTIRYYKDTRTSSLYAPSIRPHLLAKFFKENPNLGKNIFYHDSDIFLTKLPRFDLMLNKINKINNSDDIAYLSNTISYIGYNYLKSCCNRYKEKYKTLPNLDLFHGMCNIMDIDPEIVKSNESVSGGAQYLLKNIDHLFWKECETKCELLYIYLCKYEQKYPISHHIQKWTTDMWVVLWVYWKQGKKTLIHKELDFSWATGTVSDYHKKNIFHLAGVTVENNKDKFFKGKFAKLSVFDAYYVNSKLFDHISNNNATYEYVKVIKEYMDNVYISERSLSRNNYNATATAKNKTFKKKISFKNDTIHDSSTDSETNSDSISNDIHLIKRFKMFGNKFFSNIYQLEESKVCCGKPIWKSTDNSYIIFWSGSTWILTHGKYENIIGANCGGLAFTSSEYPYENKWNINVTINVL